MLYLCKISLGWVNEDPRWCQSWSHDGQSSLSSPLLRASPGPVLCWHPGPSPSCPSLAFTLGALQSVLLQSVVLPCQSGSSSCIATVSEKKRAEFWPSSKQHDCSYSAAWCKETWGRAGKNRSLSHPSLFMSLLFTVYRKMQNSSYVERFSLLSGESRRLTVLMKQFFAFLVGPESDLD